jgi:hypothetical protein
MDPHLTVMLGKMAFMSLLFGLAWHHASIIKALKIIVWKLKSCSFSDISNFLKLVFIKIPGFTVLAVLVLLIIALPFIYTGPVGGMIIWTCIVIIVRLI